MKRLKITTMFSDVQKSSNIISCIIFEKYGFLLSFSTFFTCAIFFSNKAIYTHNNFELLWFGYAHLLWDIIIERFRYLRVFVEFFQRYIDLPSPRFFFQLVSVSLRVPSPSLLKGGFLFLLSIWIRITSEYKKIRYFHSYIWI